LRVSEAVRLRIADVDLKVGILTIHRTKFAKYAACWAMPASRCATANSKAGNKNDSA